MGSVVSSAAEEEPETPPDEEEHDTDYKWPDNLFQETRDMVAASLLVYTFGYILDVARKTSVGLVGLQVDTETGRAQRSTTTSSSSALGRSFTPAEVAAIVETNKSVLAESYAENFADEKLAETLDSLKLLQNRADESKMERPLTLEEFDDKHQQHEMVYAVAKDSVNKRITLVFRGTDNELAFSSNWTTNMYVAKTGGDVPAYLKDKVDFDKLWWHSGFYNYILEKTFTDSDDPNRLKYAEIVDDVKPLLAANPGYKLYVTGHSLGGALAGLVSFYMACDADIPTPVTCFSFGAPRFGDANYLEALQILEKHDKIRFCRIVIDNDSVTAVPMWNYYHGGVQVRLYEDTHAEPEITFPRVVDSNFNKWSRTWGNSLITSINLGYGHGEYQKRVDQNEASLTRENLNVIYQQSDLTGF